MITALFNIENDIIEPVRNVFWPLNVGNIIIIAIILFGLAVLVFRIVHSREPAQKRKDLYIFSMGEHFIRAMIYEFPEPNEPENLELLKMLPETANIADLMLRERDSLYFYIGKLEKMQDATIEDGIMIVMMHNEIDDRNSYEPAGSHTDIFRGRIHLRRLHEAMPQARFYPNAGLWDGKNCHLCYYPMQSPDSLQKPMLIMYDREILGTVASLMQTIKHIKVLKELEGRASAAETKLRESNRSLAGMTNERNEMANLLAQKRYDSQAEIQHRPSLSPWLAGAIVFFAIFGTIQFMQNQYPGTPITNPLILGALIGFGGVWFVGHFMGSKQNERTTTPLTR